MKRILLLTLFLLHSFTFAAEQSKSTILQVLEKPIVVNGKSSPSFYITQPNGTFGYVGKKGETFDVTVQNKTKEDLVLHWHGIIDPNDQDGVPYVTQLPIPAGKEYHYHFVLKQAGTFWLHSHYKLQEQSLMAAPLIIHDDKDVEPEAVMFIQDFSFKDPRVIYADLRKKLQKGMDMSMPMSMSMSMNMNKADVNDVKFDAYLVNRHTLKDPAVTYVKPNQPLRLRIINASSSSNYYIDLGKLTGSLIAIDGDDIKPMTGSKFQIAIGNRLDIRINIPKGKGVYPILALPEGTKQQTGLILATENTKIPTFTETTKTSNPILNYDQEFKVSPVAPMAQHAVEQSLPFVLGGNMQTYIWTMNGQTWPKITPTMLKPNERTELIFDNRTDMAHPMHIHGHVFEITEINGKKIQGRKGDTIDVMPHSVVKVVFDSDNPGIWMLHCHVLYHQQGGMMTTLNYVGYPNKFSENQREMGDMLAPLN